MTRPSVKRSAPVKIVGAVNILAPTGSSAYYRLTWIEPDGKNGRTSAGTTLHGAVDQATALSTRLDLAAGLGGAMPLEDLVAEYTATGEGRNRKQGESDWTSTHRGNVRRKLNRAVTGHEHVQAWDVDRKLIDVLRSRAGTPNGVRELTSIVRGLLAYGHALGVFSPEQVALLPANAPKMRPSVVGTAAPKRQRKPRRAGASEQYVHDEDAPNALRIVRLGEELAVVFPEWGRLAVELAAASGPRWGEQFQLTAIDVHLDPEDYKAAGRARPFMDIESQIDPEARVAGGGDRRKAPKGEKIRSTGVPQTTITGYPLLEELRLRRLAALAEQAAGSNPEALLFPTKTGKLFHHTSFNTKYLLPAAERAGWRIVRWQETYEKVAKSTGKSETGTRTRRQMVQTWHSLRHRFARTCIDRMGMSAGELMAIGGWEDETVVRNRYYNSGEEHLDAGLKAFDVFRQD